jgi:DNA-binding MarR family transcriptional regulator
MNNREREESLTLEILETIEGQSAVTQRHLADRLGVALGLTNSYLKRCVHKGLVKIQQVPANRYLYYLTPKGFAEKSRLTAAYLSSSFDFYRQAGESLDLIYKQCAAQGWNHILFCGVSELAEIAFIRASEHDISIVGTWDPDINRKQFLHLPVWKSIEMAEKHDASLITALENPARFYELLGNTIDREKILIPSILGINHKKQ